MSKPSQSFALAVLALLFLTATACLPTTTGVLRYPASFSLAVGERVGLEPNIFIQVNAINDSRCPIDVDCFWEGDAEVFLELEGAEGEKLQSSLHSNSRFEQRLSFQGISLQLREVNPYPGSPEALAGAPSRAYFVATRPTP
ncbi:MAG: hypothetical protein R2880_08470 [Deinococcales bacterium]